MTGVRRTWKSTDNSCRIPIRRWVSVVGARPQFVKLAPVCRAIESHNHTVGSPLIEHFIINTGQHYDREVAELLFVQMGIPEPRYNLAVGSGSHGTQLARMLARMEPVLTANHIDWLIVYGDTNSTIAGALLASRLRLPVAHVEAGCRSWDMNMPEEQNRIASDHLSQLLLAPSETALQNLRREGIAVEDDPRKRCATVVGDVMYDALLQSLQVAEKRADAVLSEYGLESGGYYLLTIHRAENTGNSEKLSEILEAAASLDLPVLFPVHPRTRSVISAAGIAVKGKLIAAPSLGYLEMLAVEKHARKILTDSGGVQKEAFYLGVPCVTLRDQTEWTETVALGANRIAGTSRESIRAAVLHQDANGWNKATPYGDGRAAQRIVSELLARSV